LVVGEQKPALQEGAPTQQLVLGEQKPALQEGAPTQKISSLTLYIFIAYNFSRYIFFT